MAAQPQIDLPMEMERKALSSDGFLALIDKAIDKNLAADVVGKMLDHYERWQKIQAKKAYDDAMLAMKKVTPPIIKKKKANVVAKEGKQGYSYLYADIEECCEKLEPVMIAHGFDKSWTTEPSDKGQVAIVCIIKHVQGHEERTLLPPAPHDNSGGKNPLQAVGSTLTYLQRYSLLMALGIAPKGMDTDGRMPQPQQGGKMNAEELKERIAHFDKCSSYQEVDAHYKASFAAAHEAKDQNAKDSFIQAKKDAYARLRGKQ